MVTLKVVDYKVLRMAIQFKFFFFSFSFSDKKVNGKCDVRYLRRFLFGMSPDPVFIKTSYFELE